MGNTLPGTHKPVPTRCFRRPGQPPLQPQLSKINLSRKLRLGLVTEWSEPAESRAWAARRSADQIPLVIDFVIGLASNAAWEGLVAILRRRGRQRVRAIVGSRVTEQATERWVQVDGEAEAVASILRDLNPWTSEGK
jgi:hypothetical protein